jgi:hypothetical protein
MGSAGGELMRPLALSDFLPDFAARSHRAPDADFDQRGGAPQAPASALQPATPDLNTLIREEVAKAEAGVTERLSAIYEATLQAERENHAGELDRLRAELGTQAGATISRRLDEMESEISLLATSLTARVIGGLLTEDIQKRSLDRLSQAILDAMRDNEAVRIQVRGPQSLFEPLGAALGERAASLHYVEAPGFDLTVGIDGNLFETRLSEWSAALSGALS